MYAIASTIMALGALASAVAGAAHQGFNYGSTFSDGSVKLQADFEADFRAAASLPGTGGKFTSARLYTMVGNANGAPIQAIPAAINTGTSLLLGLWASAGNASFTAELAALTAAASQYGADKRLNVVGISVGSEDLYRISPTGQANNEFAGAGPDDLVAYIAAVRDAIRGTAFESVPIGHVDTWTAWVNGSNAAVAAAVDWVGIDAYAFFESTLDNAVGNGGNLFDDAMRAAQAAVGADKDIWVTETGWPVSGKDFGAARAGPENAKAFWDMVGCGRLFGRVNTWWYTLQDSAPKLPDPSFGVIGSSVSSPVPVFDLSCPAAAAPSVLPIAGVGAGPNTTFTSGTPVPVTSATSSAVGSSGGGGGPTATPTAVLSAGGRMATTMGSLALAVMLAAVAAADLA